MIRFGELSTKGKNKQDFIHRLYLNIKHALKDFSNLSIQVQRDHIYIGLNGEDYQPVLTRLQDVSGIHALSLVYKCSKDMEDVKASALELIKKEKHRENIFILIKRVLLLIRR
jgi:thiamine biosynthesis protein ThiI